MNSTWTELPNLHRYTMAVQHTLGTTVTKVHSLTHIGKASPSIHPMLQICTPLRHILTTMTKVDSQVAKLQDIYNTLDTTGLVMLLIGLLSLLYHSHYHVIEMLLTEDNIPGIMRCIAQDRQWLKTPEATH